MRNFFYFIIILFFALSAFGDELSKENQLRLKSCSEGKTRGEDGRCHVAKASDCAPKKTRRQKALLHKVNSLGCVNELSTRNFATLHNIAILGEKDKELKEEDVFRWTERHETQKGGGFHSVVALWCYKSSLGKWSNSSAVIVKNKRGELRALTAKHNLLNGKWDSVDFGKNTDFSSECYVISAEEMWLATGGIGCGHEFLTKNSTEVEKSTRFMSCIKAKGLAFKISKNIQILPSQKDVSGDIAILKFKNKVPNTQPLKIIKFEDEHLVAKKDPRGRDYVEIKGVKYRISLASANLGKTAKKHCSIFTKGETGKMMKRKGERITNCQGVKGFSGAPMILKNEISGKLHTNCIYTGVSASYRERRNTSFDKEHSGNRCHMITNEVFELLEK